MTDQSNPPTEFAPVAEEHAEELGLSLPDDPTEANKLLLDELTAARSEVRAYLEDLERVSAEFERFRSDAVAGDEAQAYLDDLKRVAADFENYRKRTQREMAENIERASQRVVMGLLPVLDSLDLALAHEPESPSEEKLLGGVMSTRQQLLDILTKEGLELIPSLGEEFDPNRHDAVSRAGGGHTLIVTAEMRRGYTLKGRVIRPTMVAVGEDTHPVEEDGDG